MSRQDKPYRVYRGGRVRGRVPTVPKPERTTSRDGRRRPRLRYPGPGPKETIEILTLEGTTILLALGLLFLLLIAWAVASYLSLRKGAEDANDRLPAAASAALEPQNGLLLSNSSVILLVGTDHAAYQRQREGFRRADSIMLIRTDPGKRRLS